ncbi:MAG TPA: DUF2868 domain-containing protein [Caldimonas sp.]|jgi:hypothetical protein|nr:DUF2868 domain-containing protein [Caldimonas sp.]HEX4233108.1 DUF2868 domain-containing protein [Caldimonas sp.]
MNERHARDVTWLEAFETARPVAPTWNEEDRAWADRVALEAVAAEAPADVFVADRARHALQRLGPREPGLERIAGATTWRSGWVRGVVLVAFVLGIAADAIGSAQRINLLAPPLWGVLLWNAAVYLVLIAWPLVRLLRRAPTKPGPIVRATELLLGSRRLPRASAAGSATAIRRFASLWLQRSGALAALRAETVLHAGAAALALGLIAGMYARGLVLDYRVVWESTLLEPPAAHAVVSTVFGPAARLAAIALPDEAAFAALRATRGDTVVGAPAAAWLHLIALTLVGAVVLPRTLLALGCAAIVAARTRRFALPLDAPYFQRLVRLRRGRPARVSVYPYGIAPTPQATLGLRALLAAALGPHLALEFAPTVGFGREDDAAPSIDSACTHVVALFDLSATPELENQGRFLRALLAATPGGAVVAAVVDATAFDRRFAAVGERVTERRDAWRRWGEAVGAVPVVVALEDADAVAMEAELQTAFAMPGAQAAP